jgi:FkbM family methyltransferase
VRPGGRIYAFEPTPRTREALTDHLGLNEVADDVTVVPMAVGDRDGAAEFFTYHDSPENTLAAAHSRLPGARAVTVQLTTIDGFCEGRSIVPSLIKLDVEGFELHALRGARRTLMRHRPRVVIEVHPMNWPDAGVDRRTAEELLSELGCRAIPIDGQADPLAELGHVILEYAAPAPEEGGS